MAAPLRELFAGRLEDLELGDAPDWFVELERRIDGSAPTPALPSRGRGRSIENLEDRSVTEQTQFAVGRSDPASAANVGRQGDNL